MKPSNGSARPSPLRKSEDERGERSKSGISPRLEKGSPPRNDSVEDRCVRGKKAGERFTVFRIAHSS